MKHLLSFFLLGAVLLGMNGCDKAEDFSGPSADIQNVTAGQSFISFEIKTDNSDEVAYKVTAADAASLTAEQLFSEGTVVLPGYPGCENGLEANAEYTVYAASRTADGTYSKVASYKVRTKEAGHFKVDISYINYSTVAFKEIVPDDLNKEYVMFSFSRDIEETLEYFGIDSIDDIPEYMYKNDYINDFSIYEGTIDNNFSEICFAIDAPSNSDVNICLWYINDDKSPASAIECTTVKTSPVPNKSPLYIDIDKFDIQDEGVNITFNSNVDLLNDPTMSFETWSGLAYYKATLFEEGMTDFEIAQTVLDYFHNNYDKNIGECCYIENGKQIFFKYRNEFSSNCIPDYQPGEEYRVVLFGTYDGKITTKPIIRKFIMPDDGKDNENEYDYTLKVDKSEISIGQSTTFTVASPDGKDVTPLSTICMVDGMCLAGNIFTATETGTFDFEAHYLGMNGDVYIPTNIVTVTVK